MFRSLLIGVAIFGLGWGASFGAGVAYGKRGSAAAVQAAAVPGGAALATGGQAGAQGSGQGGQAGPGAQAAGARGAAGVVDRIDGSTLTLSGPNNQQVKVTLTDQTRILKEASGTVADLATGTRVTIQPQGQPGADGAFTAAIVNVIPEGIALAGLQGQGQRAPGQGGQGGQPGQGAQAGQAGQGGQNAQAGQQRPPAQRGG